MKKLFMLIFVLSFMCLYAYADGELKVFEQQKIYCVKTSETIEIDGNYDKAWDKALPVSMYSVTTVKEPLTPATVRCLYDDQNIYIFMKAKDKDITAYELKADGSTCQDDVLEIFLRCGAKSNWYYNAEINAIGTAYTGKNHVGGGTISQRAGHLWNPDIDYAIHIQGTVNNYTDTDQFWTLEVKIPFAQLDELKGKAPKAGDVWYCNFAKYDYSIYLKEFSGMELATVCHTNNVAFHEIINYCPLIFK